MRFIACQQLQKAQNEATEMSTIKDFMQKALISFRTFPVLPLEAL
jgi:hypothetical protein